jgi:hypothetical protein
VAPPRSFIFAGTGNVPWRYRDYERYRYRVLTTLDAWKPVRPHPQAFVDEAIGDAGRNHERAYVIVTRSAEIQAALVERRPMSLNAWCVGAG